MPWLGVRGGLPWRHTSLGWPWEAVCARDTETHHGVKILLQLPPHFQRLVIKLLSFTTNNLLLSPDVLFRMLLLWSRAGQKPSLSFALVYQGGRGDGCCTRAQGPRGVSGNRGVLYFPILSCLSGEYKLQLSNHSHPQTTHSFHEALAKCD